MELDVQKYLRTPGHSLATLKADLGIEYNTHGMLAILNYSQIDSPKSHPIVSECRGLILEQDSWDVVCMPFKRFYNYGEMQDTVNFDFTKACGLQKLDGTLISVFNYKDQWLMATRGVIENTCKCGLFDITFKQLFMETTKQYLNFWKDIDKDYTYCFELTAPENRVVTMYPDRRLTLILAREVESLKELDINCLHITAGELGTPLPEIVQFNSSDELIELAKKLATLEEGFVAVDYSRYMEDGISFNRVKVKNPSYVAIAHLKDRAGRSMRALMRLVMSNDTQEFLSYYPEFKELIDKVQTAYDEYLYKIEEDVKGIREYFKTDTMPADRKAFAAVVLKTTNSDFIFKLYEGKIKSFSEFIANQEKTKGKAWIEKYLVSALKLKDIKLYSE